MSDLDGSLVEPRDESTDDELTLEELLSTPRQRMLYLAGHLSYVLDCMLMRAEGNGEQAVRVRLLETDAAVGLAKRLLSRRERPPSRRRAVWQREVHDLRRWVRMLEDLADDTEDEEFAAALAPVHPCLDRLGEHLDAERLRRTRRGQAG